MDGDLLSNSINVNAQDVAAQLKSTSPVLSEGTQAGILQIVSARYHLDTGAVEFLGNDSQSVLRHRISQSCRLGVTQPQGDGHDADTNC